MYVYFSSVFSCADSSLCFCRAVYDVLNISREDVYSCQGCDFCFSFSISLFLQKFVDRNLISKDKFPLSCSYFFYVLCPDHVPDSHSMISFVTQITAKITHKFITQPFETCRNNSGIFHIYYERSNIKNTTWIFKY